MNTEDLIAIGGDLRPQTIIDAYQKGLFPWFEQGQPILWWSPNPRTILDFQDFKISKSLNKKIKNHKYKIYFDSDFEQVILECAKSRNKINDIEDNSTWINPQMITSYNKLFKLGIAHCVTVYSVTNNTQTLAGGLYGLAIGRNFFGESMFHTQSDGSKIAVYYLIEHLKKLGFNWLDCQVWSEHLSSLGAKTIPKSDFLKLLATNNQFANSLTHWDAVYQTY